MFTFYTDLIIFRKGLLGDNMNQKWIFLRQNTCESEQTLHLLDVKVFHTRRKDRTVCELTYKRTGRARLRQEKHWPCDIYYILPLVKVTIEDHGSHMNAHTSMYAYRVHIWYSYTHTHTHWRCSHGACPRLYPYEVSLRMLVIWQELLSMCVCASCHLFSVDTKTKIFVLDQRSLRGD